MTSPSSPVATASWYAPKMNVHRQVSVCGPCGTGAVTCTSTCAVSSTMTSRSVRSSGLSPSRPSMCARRTGNSDSSRTRRSSFVIGIEDATPPSASSLAIIGSASAAIVTVTMPGRLRAIEIIVPASVCAFPVVAFSSKAASTHRHRRGGFIDARSPRHARGLRDRVCPYEARGRSSTWLCRADRSGSRPRPTHRP